METAVTSAPRIVLGVPLYNRARFLPEAIESLLGQTHPHVSLVLVDDCSSDETPQIAERYATAHPQRVDYVRNPERLAMVGSWQRAYRLARELHPDAPYFAWGSDHDVWHPRWAQALVEVLEASPEAVLAYPLSRRLSEHSEVFYETWSFATRGVTDPRLRMRRTITGMAAGFMIYGLFRVDALERTGGFRRVILPDRLLLTELSLQGEFHQVPEVLWYRRLMVAVTFSRQRNALFAPSAPLSSYAPWWLTHSCALGWTLTVQAPESARGRLRGLSDAATHLAVSARYGAGRRVKRTFGRARMAGARRVRALHRTWRRGLRLAAKT